MDLAELWRGGLSVRRLSVLISHLPEGSAVWSKRSDIPRGWTTQSWLMADLFQAMSGEAHPARPKPGSGNAEARKFNRTAALLDHKRRMAEREALLTEAQP